MTIKIVVPGSGGASVWQVGEDGQLQQVGNLGQPGGQPCADPMHGHQQTGPLDQMDGTVIVVPPGTDPAALRDVLAEVLPQDGSYQDYTQQQYPQADTDACGAAACAADACAVAACAADAGVLGACGAELGIVDADVAEACGAQANAFDIGVAEACGAEAGVIDTCVAQACGAAACGADLCPIDACGAEACPINVVPIIPLI